MLKRYLHILLSVWLINVLVCFHSTDPFLTDQTAGLGLQCVSPTNSIVDILVNHWGDDCDDHRHPHIVTHNRFVGSRSVVLNIQLPAIQQFHFVDPGKLVHALFPRFWEDKVFLPPHHHFLFRLSPF